MSLNWRAKSLHERRMSDEAMDARSIIKNVLETYGKSEKLRTPTAVRVSFEWGDRVATLRFTAEEVARARGAAPDYVADKASDFVAALSRELK
jgi:hypothetical protein